MAKQSSRSAQISSVNDVHHLNDEEPHTSLDSPTKKVSFETVGMFIR